LFSQVTKDFVTSYAQAEKIQNEKLDAQVFHLFLWSRVNNGGSKFASNILISYLKSLVVDSVSWLFFVCGGGGFSVFMGYLYIGVV